MKKHENSVATILIVAASVIVICFGGLVIGVKLEYPEANIALPMPVVVLAVLWFSIHLAYYAAVDTVLRAMSRAFPPEEEKEEDESGRTQITSMGE
jgi:hypothetical protein